MSGLSCPICLCSRVPPEYLEKVDTTDRECFAALQCGHVAHEACLLMVRRPPERDPRDKSKKKKPEGNKSCPCCKNISKQIFRLYIQRSTGSSSPVRPSPAAPARTRPLRIHDDCDDSGEQTEEEDVQEQAEDPEVARRRMISEFRATIADLKQQQRDQAEREERKAQEATELQNSLIAVRHRLAEAQEQVRLAQRQQTKFDDLRKKLSEKDKSIQELRKASVSKEQSLHKIKEEARALREDLAQLTRSHEDEVAKLYEERNETQRSLARAKVDNGHLRDGMESWKSKYEHLQAKSRPSLGRAPATEASGSSSSAKRKVVAGEEPREATAGPNKHRRTTSSALDADSLSIGGMKIKDRTQLARPDPFAAAAAAASLSKDSGLWWDSNAENDDSVVLTQNHTSRASASAGPPSQRQSAAAQVICISSDDASEEDTSNEFSFLDAAERGPPARPAFPKSKPAATSTTSGKGKQKASAVKASRIPEASLFCQHSFFNGSRTLSLGPKSRKKIR